MVAPAPEDHPAKVATRRLRAVVQTGLTAPWLLFFGRMSARDLANGIASGKEGYLEAETAARLARFVD